MFTTLSDVQAFVRDQSVEMIDLKFCDLWGRWRHVTVPASQLGPALMEEGVGFDGSSVGLKGVESGDMVLVPDLSTGFVDPFTQEPTLSFICSILEADTRAPFGHDPRTVAARAEAFLKTAGVAERSVWGPEFEFYLFDDVAYESGVQVSSYRIGSAEGRWSSREPGSGYSIQRGGGYAAVPPRDHLHDARTRIARHLEAMGVPVKYHHHEVGGPGQCEIEIPMMPLVKACDAVLLAKHAVRMTALQMGLTATFMPKPLYDEAGSGMHCHQQLWEGTRNLFYDPAGYGSLSSTGASYVAGLLSHGAAVMAFTNPSTNSYRRLVPDHEAPVTAIYSLANRSAAIRIPKYANKPDTARFEFRPPDATANPYLAMAAQLMAGVDGVRRRLDPTALGFGPIDEDLFSWPAERLARIPALPTSLPETLDAVEKDGDFLYAGDVMSPELVRRWVARKRDEDRAVRNRPHPHEFELYYDL